MARNVTLTFEDGTTHQYNGVPDDITPDQVVARAGKEFGDKKISNIDGGAKAAPVTEKPGILRRAAGAVGDALSGPAEAGLTMATGLGSMLAGDTAGIKEAATQKIQDWIRNNTNQVPQDGNKYEVGAPMPQERTGKQIADQIKQDYTYEPRGETGKAINSTIGTVMYPITKAARFAGDVVEGATGEPFAGDIANDAANLFLTKKTMQAAPKAYGVAKEVVPAVANKAVDLGLKSADIATRPGLVTQGLRATAGSAAGGVPGVVAGELASGWLNPKIKSVIRERKTNAELKSARDAIDPNMIPPRNTGNQGSSGGPNGPRIITPDMAESILNGGTKIDPRTGKAGVPPTPAEPIINGKDIKNGSQMLPAGEDEQNRKARNAALRQMSSNEAQQVTARVDPAVQAKIEAGQPSYAARFTALSNDPAYRVAHEKQANGETDIERDPEDDSEE